jgi:hypothetical protein
VWDIEWAQYQRIEHTEDDSIGANGQRQCEHRGHGEPGRLVQLAQGKA